MYLTQAVHRALSLHPERLATVCGERRQSFADFAGRVARLAGALRQIGMNPGDRVRIELSPYDLDRGRIVYRLRPGDERD